MKQFIAFIRKEFFHIFRDTRTILILLGMPIAQILLFGFAISTEVKDVRIAVLDPSKDATTKKIIQQVSASKYFTLTDYLESPEQIERTLKRGEANVVMVFGDRFESRLRHTGDAEIQLIIDASDPNQGTTAANYLASILSQASQSTAQTAQASGGCHIRTVTKMLYNPQMEGAYNFVPGVMGLILMIICAMMTSIAIVREKERGSMEVLFASPVKPLFIIVAKATPYFALSAINVASILLLSVFVLGMPISGSLTLIILASLLFTLVALALGLLISNLVQTQVAAMLFSGMGLMAPTMILSGMLFPIESMPSVFQWASCIVPARWYIDIVRKLMIQGVDGIYVMKEFAVLALMLLVLLGISLKTFKKRLQ